MVRSEARDTPSFPLHLWGVILVYLSLNALTQYLVSATADLDQSEQLVLSQDWQLGYSVQPPLYTWLVRSVFAITGPNLASLLGMKVVLLSALAGILIGIGRQFSFTMRQHLITVVSMVFIPQFIWESQRDLTHSVLAAVMAAATLLQIVRTRRSPSMPNYLSLGLLAGLGLISKYNYAIFLASLITTLLFTRSYMQVVKSRRILISIAIAAAVSAPHLAWVVNHMNVAAGGLHELYAARGDHLAGAGHALFSALAFLTPLWIISLLVVSNGNGGWNTNQLDDRTFISNLFVVTLAITAVFVFAAGTQEIKERWYQPLLFFTPVLVALHASPSRRRLVMYCALGIFFAVCVAIALPARTLLAERLKHTSRPNIPYPGLARSLAGLAGEPVAILAENNLLGGNVRPFFSSSRIITPDYEAPSSVYPPGMQLVLCETPGCKDNFRNWMRERHAIDLDLLRFNRLEQPYYYTPMRKHVLYWAQAGVSQPAADRKLAGARQ